VKSVENLDESLVSLYREPMLAVRDGPEDIAQLEYQLRSKAIRENCDMNDLIQDAVVLYLEKSPSARASFQRLVKDPPLRGTPEEVAACLEGEDYAQRVIQLIT
jgi:hypothetical protein